MNRYLLPIALILVALPAHADRPVTATERAEIVKVLSAEGCTGGEFEFDTDDNEFEVEDATCADGHEYDFELDLLYRITDKDRDD